MTQVSPARGNSTKAKEIRIAFGRIREAYGRSSSEMVQAIVKASPRGRGFRAVAAVCNVQPSTVTNWAEPSVRQSIPLCAFLTAVTDEEVTPAVARDVVMSSLCAAVGGVYVDGAKLGVHEGDVLESSLAAMESVGQMAGSIREGLGECSPGGATLTAGEREEIAGCARRMVQEGLAILATLGEGEGERDG